MATSADESSSPSPSRSTTNHDTNQIANAIRNSSVNEVFDHVVGLILSPNGRNHLESLPNEEVDGLWFTIAADALVSERDSEDLKLLFDLLFDVENTSKGLSFAHIEYGIDLSIDDKNLSFALLTRMIEHVANSNSSESVLENNENGNTLLHSATLIPYPKSTKLIRFLHHENRNWIWHQNNNHELPLHTAFHDHINLIYEDYYNFIRTLLELNPHAAKVKNKQGKLPFHILMCEPSSQPANIPPVRLLELAYEAHPLAVKTKLPSEEFNFEYPLHYLFRHNYDSNPRVFSEPRRTCFVLEKFPKCIFLPNGIGLTPFQVISDDFGENGIMQVLDHIAESEPLTQCLTDTRDPQNGNNILHVLSKRTFTDEAAQFFQLNTASIVFQESMERFPNLVVQENNQGNLPIQVLLQNNGNQYDFEEVTALVEAYDDYCNEHKITKRLDCPPNVNDGTDGNEYPLILAASQKDACLSTIYYLATRFVARRGGFIL